MQHNIKNITPQEYPRVAQQNHYQKKSTTRPTKSFYSSSEEERRGPDKSFYKNYHIDSNEDSGSYEEESKESYISDSSRSGNTPQPKRGPVYSFVKTNKGNFNWGVRYPAK